MVDGTNFESKTGASFKPDSMAVIFREGQLVMDFKKTSPRLDQSGNDKIQTIVSEHNPVVLNPERAKAFSRMLEQNIKNYEEKYGKIELDQEDQEQETKEPEDQDYIA